MRIGVDLTACWRPRVGMVSAALELTRALLELGPPEHDLVLLCSRERAQGFEEADCEAILSPHRHEVANKLRWLPRVEGEAALDAILYPYWPSPPRRGPGAPPAVVMIHDLAYRVRPAEVPWQQRLYLGLLVPRALRSAEAVLTPSESTRSDLLRHYQGSIDPARVHVVPEAAAGLGDAPAPLPPGLRPGFLLCVGTLESRKNHLRLLDAYQRLRRSRPETPDLVVVGRPGWGAEGRLIQRRLQEAEGVRLLGHVDDATLLALYRGAGLLAFPSLYEGFGLPLVEAMREGVPALVGSRGALPELAGGAALEVDAEDVGAIQGGLARLLEDEALRAELSERGRRRSALYSWRAAAESVLAILRGLGAPAPSIR